MRAWQSLRHLVVFAPALVREFGVATYLRAWLSLLHRSRRLTFVELLVDMNKTALAQKISSTSPTARRSL